MATIKTISAKFQALDTQELISAVFSAASEAFTEEQKKQLYAGFNKSGERLRKYASPKYARVKNEMNPRPGLGNPDLKVTGAFYDGIKSTVSGVAMHVESTDSKAAELESKYINIYGLGGEFKKEFIDTSIRPKFRWQIKVKTGL